MNEHRAAAVDAAREWIGVYDGGSEHKGIIDLYNSHKPLARGYAVTYTDEWCATFVSAVAIKCGLTDIMPTECGCEQMILLYKALGRWVEDDGYTPAPGDIIFYDWDDSGIGNNTGYSDHVGIVESVDGDNITVIEGNISDSVGRRAIKVNNRYIRGYGVPDYESKPDKELDIGDPSDWARESCTKAVAKGVYHGDGDGNFRWRDGITREELAVVLDNAGILG